MSRVLGNEGRLHSSEPSHSLSQLLRAIGPTGREKQDERSQFHSTSLSLIIQKVIPYAEGLTQVVNT